MMISTPTPKSIYHQHYTHLLTYLCVVRGSFLTETKTTTRIFLRWSNLNFFIFSFPIYIFWMENFFSHFLVCNDDNEDKLNFNLQYHHHHHMVIANNFFHFLFVFNICTGVAFFLFSDFLILSKLIIIIIGKILIIFIYIQKVKQRTSKNSRSDRKKRSMIHKAKNWFHHNFRLFCQGEFSFSLLLFGLSSVIQSETQEKMKIFQVPYWTLNFFKIGTIIIIGFLFLLLFSYINFLIVYRYLWEKNHHL